MLYGDGDFKKSMLIALSCGDDIVTGTINPCISLPLPKNCKELTEKVVSLAPAVLRFNQVNGNYVGFGDKTEISEDEKKKLAVPQEYLDDFIARRKVNLAALLHTLKFVGSDIDEFTILQDDSNPYGFSALYQKTVREFTKNEGIDIDVHPGADEGGL